VCRLLKHSTHAVNGRRCYSRITCACALADGDACATHCQIMASIAPLLSSYDHSPLLSVLCVIFCHNCSTLHCCLSFLITHHTPRSVTMAIFLGHTKFTVMDPRLHTAQHQECDCLTSKHTVPLNSDSTRNN
jgi:hypothetical protein